jgi:hypothetical protein
MICRHLYKQTDSNNELFYSYVVFVVVVILVFLALVVFDSFKMIFSGRVAANANKTAYFQNQFRKIVKHILFRCSL